jgi:hypothetical protein
MTLHHTCIKLIFLFFILEFFEHVAEEARLDANMPVIMKNAVYARKTLAKKARSQLLEQSRQENAKTLGKTKSDGDYFISSVFFTWVFCFAWLSLLTLIYF